MYSLRTRITVTMLCVILVALVIVTLLSAIFIRRIESHKSDQLLMMLCESGQRSLDYYFDSVENSVIKVTSFIEEDLEGLEDEKLKKHMENARQYFGLMTSKTKGVLTYYYRIDPSVSSSVKGFWYTDLTGEGFEEHKVTELTLYDLEDTSKLVWFTIPKHEGKPVWIPPYITDNLVWMFVLYPTMRPFIGRDSLSESWVLKLIILPWQRKLTVSGSMITGMLF